MLAEELTPDRAVQIALLNNRNLQAAYEGLGVAQADLVAAGLLKNPVFDGDLRFSTRGGGTAIDLSLVADFLDVLFIPLRKRLAEQGVSAAKLTVSAAVVDLARDVREAVYELQAATQTVEMRQSVVAATGASYDLAKRLHAAGNVSDLDLARERALFEQSKLDLAASEVDVAQLRERLNGLMGLWGNDTQWAVAGRLADVPANDESTDPVERVAVERSLDLAMSRARIELAERQLGVARPLGWLSDLELGVTAERETGGGWSVGPAISLPLPIFSQGRPAVAAGEARWRAAVNRHYALAVEVRAGARAAQLRVVAARQRAEYYRRVLLPLRRQITAETQKRFNAMQIGAFELLRAKQEEIETGRAAIVAVKEYWVARGRMDSILSGRIAPAGMPSDVAEGEPRTGTGNSH
jgi:cobalt-zinc-cadmium efflux system outer membrane protein